MGKGRIPIPGKRGRPPAPVEETTWKVAPAKMPPTPAELTGEGLAEWTRLEPYLLAIDRVSDVDSQALHAYCLYWHRFSYLMATYFADESALLYSDGPTCEVPHPLLPDLIGFARDLIGFAGDFGLTARSRDLDGNHGNRIPAALKRFFGNRRKVAESKIPESVIPMMPKWESIDPPLWANRRIAKLYQEAVSQLELLDLFTPLDYAPVVVMCCLQDLLLRANEQLRYDFTEVLDKKTGDVLYVKSHPLYQVLRQLGDVNRHYWKGYGMNPRSRKIFASEKTDTKKERPVVFKGKFG